MFSQEELEDIEKIKNAYKNDDGITFLKSDKYNLKKLLKKFDFIIIKDNLFYSHKKELENIGMDSYLIDDEGTEIFLYNTKNCYFQFEIEMLEFDDIRNKYVAIYLLILGNQDPYDTETQEFYEALDKAIKILLKE